MPDISSTFYKFICSYFGRQVFVSLACGSLVVYSRPASGRWREAETRVVDLPNCSSISRMVAAAGAVWCSQNNSILIFDPVSACVEVSEPASTIHHFSRLIKSIFYHRLRSTWKLRATSVTWSGAPTRTPLPSHPVLMFSSSIRTLSNFSAALTSQKTCANTCRVRNGCEFYTSFSLLTSLCAQVSMSSCKHINWPVSESRVWWHKARRCSQGPRAVQ